MRKDNEVISLEGTVNFFRIFKMRRRTLHNQPLSRQGIFCQSDYSEKNAANGVAAWNYWTNKVPSWRCFFASHIWTTGWTDIQPWRGRYTQTHTLEAGYRSQLRGVGGRGKGGKGISAGSSRKLGPPPRGRSIAWTRHKLKVCVIIVCMDALWVHLFFLCSIFV